MHFTKHHGLGNDFLVALEANNGPLSAAQSSPARCAIDTPALVPTG